MQCGLAYFNACHGIAFAIIMHNSPALLKFPLCLGVPACDSMISGPASAEAFDDMRQYNLCIAA